MKGRGRPRTEFRAVRHSQASLLLLVLNRRFGPSTVRGSHPAEKSGRHVQFGLYVRRLYEEVMQSEEREWFIDRSSTSARLPGPLKPGERGDDPELAATSDGIYVRLLWHPDNGQVDHGDDAKTGEAFELVLRATSGR